MNERQIFKDVDGRIVAELRAQLDAANARITGLQRIIYQYEEREAACCPEDVGFDGYVALLKKQLDAANARIAELEAAQAWVSVDEWLPPAEVDVLVKTKAGCAIAFRTPNTAEYGLTWIVTHGAHNITHWMPLPPPPVTDVTPQHVDSHHTPCDNAAI